MIRLIFYFFILVPFVFYIDFFDCFFNFRSSKIRSSAPLFINFFVKFCDEVFVMLEAFVEVLVVLLLIKLVVGVN